MAKAEVVDRAEIDRLKALSVVERWGELPGFNGDILFSTQGNVKTKPGAVGVKVLTSEKTSCGPSFTINYEGRSSGPIPRTRGVAATFLDVSIYSENDQTYANRIRTDGDWKTDCSLENIKVVHYEIKPGDKLNGSVNTWFNIMMGYRNISKTMRPIC